MSNQSTYRFFVVLLFAAVASAALVLVDVGARAQNSNSSTAEEGAQNANMNANGSANANAPRRGRGRRGRTRTPPPADSTTEPSADAQAATPATGQTADDDGFRGDLSGEQVDLSGTYSGRVRTTGAHEMSDTATLTITGNTFTLTGEGMTHSGRVYSVLTRGATSAAFYFSDIQDPVTSTPVVFNVRARKSGDRLTLTPAPNTRNRLTFTPVRARG